MAKSAGSKKRNQPQVVSKPVKAGKVSPKSSSSTLYLKWASLIFLGICGLIFLQARIQLLAIPLERDEGSFAYIGHWLLRGRELYTDMLDSKLPGLYTYYAFFTTLFGNTATGVHIGLLVANIISAVCFYVLLKEMYSRLIAVMATSFFLFMAISLNMMGFAAHATQLLTPFVLGSFLCFWKGIYSHRSMLIFLSGLLIGLAFTIKQQSAIYGILLAILWWPARLKWYKKENAKLPIMEWILLGVGGFLPVAVVIVYFWSVGRLDEFYNWTYIQPVHLAASFQESWYQMFFKIIPNVIDKFEGIWILAGTGLVLIFISGFKKEGPWFGVSMAVLGLVSVAIGAAYYKHYFVLTIPGIALLSASSLHWLAQKTGAYGFVLSLAIAAILIGVSMSGRSDYYFQPDYAKIHYQTYYNNMFPELEKIGQELKQRVPEGERIAIMGSEPEVLVAAERESCSRHLMVYSLLSDPVLSPPLQQEYIKELQECAPEYIVWNTVNGSWTKNYEKLAFFQPLVQWLELNYTAIGMAESREDKPGIIVWDEALTRHQPQSEFRVLVFKRKN